MSKKLVVLFIFFIVPLVLPFLFYHAWKQEVIISPQQTETDLAGNSARMTAQLKEEFDMPMAETDMRQVMAVSNSAVHAGTTTNISYAPGVTAQMQTPEFWLEQCENPQELLWTKKEISTFNQQVLNTEELAYNIFRQEFRDEFQSELSGFKKIALEEKEMQQWEEYSYGICVTRTEIKEFPQEKTMGEDAYFDENLLTTVRVNTPVLVDGQTEDGEYYHVISYDYQGWTLSENVALCTGLEEWEQVVERSGWATFAGEIEAPLEQNILIVTVPRLRVEITEELLTMGTIMRLLTTEEAKEILPEERFWGCYAVELAGRTEDGRYEPRYETIPVSEGVSTEYLEFTRENLLKQMYLFWGQAYGWGGSYGSVDCSGLIQDVMASFGLLFPRDAKEQSEIPTERIMFTETMDEIEREEILKVLNPGDLLYFPGHIMFYLGQYEDEYYVYSAVGSMKNSGVEGEMLNVRRVVVNSLSMERKDGSSWQQALDTSVLFS